MHEELSNEEQIDELNARVKTYIGVSKIHGVGVFALREIAKGQKLYADYTPTIYTLSYSHFNKLFLEVREYLIERWPRIVTGSKFAYPTDRVQAHMNHLEDCNYDAINDVVLKDIDKDEEITENYKLISGWEVAFPWLVEVTPQEKKEVKKIKSGKKSKNVI